MAVSRYRSVIEFARAYARVLAGTGVLVRFEVRGRREQSGAQVVAIFEDGDRTGEDRAAIATLRALDSRSDADALRLRHGYRISGARFPCVRHLAIVQPRVRA